MVAQLGEFSQLIGALVELARGDRIALESRPTVVLGEHDRLRRAVGNLLDNALKYGDASPVEVRVADGRVTVGDRGPGIDPAHHERIFDRFHRTPDSRGAPGSGLGLAIVKQIAESHRGTIRAESRPWGGTAFTLDLPTTDGA